MKQDGWRGTFSKNCRPKTCGRYILWTVGWIAFKFDVVALWVFLMIWLNFGENPLKTRWPTENILKKTSHPKSLWARYIMNRWLDRIKILYSGSLDISNDLITFFEIIKDGWQNTSWNKIFESCNGDAFNVFVPKTVTSSFGGDWAYLNIWHISHIVTGSPTVLSGHNLM